MNTGLVSLPPLSKAFGRRATPPRGPNTHHSTSTRHSACARRMLGAASSPGRAAETPHLAEPEPSPFIAPPASYAITATRAGKLHAFRALIGIRAGGIVGEALCTHTHTPGALFVVGSLRSTGLLPQKLIAQQNSAILLSQPKQGSNAHSRVVDLNSATHFSLGSLGQLACRGSRVIACSLGSPGCAVGHGDCRRVLFSGAMLEWQACGLKGGGEVAFNLVGHGRNAAWAGAPFPRTAAHCSDGAGSASKRRAPCTLSMVPPFMHCTCLQASGFQVIAARSWRATTVRSPCSAQMGTSSRLVHGAGPRTCRS